MLKLIVVVAIAVAAVAADLQSDWLIFKDFYGKTYDSKEVEELRKAIWVGNKKLIDAHNKRYANGLSTYYLGENEFADMTNSEFVAKMNGMKVNMKYQPDKHVRSNMSLPHTVDWRKKGYVTPIKNQGQCGSCWAFSATGSMEGQHFKATNKLVSLSESNLVDCSGSFGNMGCNGGWMDYAFKYVIANHGIDTEKSYPYKAEDQPCHFKSSSVGATISSYKDVTSGSESALQEAVATVGPISVAIDASLDSFQFYKGGVYDAPDCSSTFLDHGVLAVGYGTYHSKAYWLVKNSISNMGSDASVIRLKSSIGSWGTSWGLKGYIMMSRNKHNQCGIATKASYPLV